MEDIILPINWSTFDSSDTNVPWPQEMSMDARFYLEKYCRWSRAERRYYYMHILNDEIFDDLMEMLDDITKTISITYDIQESDPRRPKTLKRSISDLAKRLVSLAPFSV